MSTPSIAATTPKSLLARAVGVMTSPRATYADVAAHPRVLGALVTVIVIIAAATFAFLSTDVGQRAMVDQQLSTMESFGVKVTDQMMEGIERGAARGAYFSAVGIVVFVPVVMAVMAGLAMVVFNAILGGDATFTQLFAIVAHSGFIAALQTIFSMPLNYLRESMSSATSLAVFLPMLDPSSFLGMLFGSIDLFRLWATLSLAIGFGVLYKRRTAPIAWSLLALYGIIVLVVAGIRAALSGA
jgi:hypothetical protein